ncbi:MAG: peptidase domain protein [Fibrobacteres bacterium]|nr:peptidase domain protein [Fibrobacterota bacterium]
MHTGVGLTQRNAVNMDIRTTRLENGVVVATESLPNIRSASLGVYLDIGSRDEVPKTNGLAHLFEHMVFKGTHKHGALEIVKCFEATGGQINAYTSKEQTCFYAKVVDTEVNAGLSMLLEMVLESTFDKVELEKEKDVIIEEIKGGNDNPEDYIYDLFSQAIFDKHSLGFPIAGDEKTVKGLTREHLLDHQRKAAESLPLFVTAVGRVSHEEVVAIARKAFKLGKAPAGTRSGTPSRARNAKAAALAVSGSLVRKTLARPGGKLTTRHLLEKRPVQQVTALLGGPGYAWEHPNRYALLLLNTVLGDGMSSKLFQSVREALGLVYTIYSSPEFLINAGVYAIGFATEPKDIGKAIKEINKQMTALKKDGLKKDEMEFAKANLRGSILLGLESTNTRMANLSRQLMYGKDGETIESILKKLDEVRPADVRLAIKDIFRSERWGSAAILPKKATLSMGRLLDF